MSIETDIAVIGAGPAGYAAAFYAASLEKNVALIEQSANFGGTCLNHGCIPSKALLHIAKILDETNSIKNCGINFSPPVIDLSKMRQWKEETLEKLRQGIVSLAARRKVQVISGYASFENNETLNVKTSDKLETVHAKKIILATGSAPSLPKAFDINDSRIMTSTEALEIRDIPSKLLVIGGGYIGMELGTVYSALGSEVTIVEYLDHILLGADPDLTRYVLERAQKTFREIRTKTKVLSLKPVAAGIEATMSLDGKEFYETYDKVLISVGRTPNTKNLSLEKTKVQLDEKGFIKTDLNQKTNDETIYAIGDAAGGMLLAHKASKEARIAVNAILNITEKADKSNIPAVVFTNPEVAWVGLTECAAREKKIPVQIVKFPWSASGRAIATERTDGTTKLVVEPSTEKILGVGICGVGAGELIAEAALAINSQLTVREWANTIHPHPTLSETLSEACEMFYGTSTHAFSRKR